MTQLTMMRRQATTVVMSAPTAIGQKSLGVPAQVRGIRRRATITIHSHRCRFKPAKDKLSVEMCSLYRPMIPPALATREPRSCEMRTMKTHPPPYKVREMQTKAMILPTLSSIMRTAVNFFS